MAKLPNSFNAKDHEKMDDFSALPAGEYLAQIVKSEIKPTKDKRGKRLVLSLKVLQGKFKGRMMFPGLNIVNDNDQTVAIANKELATIQDACGVTGDIDDTEELHGIPMVIKTGIKPATPNYPEKTKIVMYSKFNMPEVDSGDGASNTSSSEKKRPWD